MKYTKKHLNAVRERLLEYEFTLESGEFAMGSCVVCDSKPLGCSRCCFDDTCFTRARRKNTTHIYDVIYNLEKLDLNIIRTRYNEIKQDFIKKDIWRLI